MANELFSSNKRLEFNHDSVGLTHPLNHPAETDFLDSILDIRRRERPDEDNGKLHSCWWPPSLDKKTNNPGRWRVLKYRCRVGKGQAAYNRVRDAAMAWEFHVSTPRNMGMIPATKHKGALPRGPMGSNTVQPFVSFTEAKLGPSIGKWKIPSLYAINPVAVVYRLLNQRIHGDIYSSTAYATLNGHLLTGEERVSVLLRGKGEHVDVEIVSYSRAAPSICGRIIWPLIGSLQDQFFVTHLKVLQQKAVE
eukprot:scaffold33296_cov34-Attheya_sp.AAC.2